MVTSHSSSHSVRRRANAARVVSKHVAATSAEHALPVQNDDGSRPVVVALDSDLVSEVLRRVSKWGSANVVVDLPGGVVVLGCVNNGRELTFGGDSQTLHEDIDMGMLVDSLDALADASGEFRIKVELGSDPANTPTITRLPAHC